MRAAAMSGASPSKDPHRVRVSRQRGSLLLLQRLLEMTRTSPRRLGTLGGLFGAGSIGRGFGIGSGSFFEPQAVDHAMARTTRVRYE